MKIIQEAAPATRMVCGSQKETTKEPCRRTSLCLEAACDEGTLLYHTLTGELLLLNKEDAPETVREYLTRHWFLVPEGFDEAAFADKVSQIAGLLDRNGEGKARKKSFTILTTTDCNARCYYCYEAGVARQTMSPDTARDTADYIARVCGGGEVTLRWFGGEPLLNTGAMDSICRRLAGQSIPYRSFMITNGYYLTPDTVEKAVSLWHLQKVQITLDGVGEVYDRVKAYVNAAGSAYERVLLHAEAARAAGIGVHIRLHLGEKNESELARLVEELARRFRQKDGLSVYVSLLGDFSEESGRFVGKSRVAERYLALTDKIRAAGLAGDGKPLPRELRKTACMAENDESDIILPDGRLCRCDLVLEKSCCGSIYTAERDMEQLQSWKERIHLPECAACALYPRCICLKKCGWVGANCPEYLQTIRKQGFREQMVETYQKWKENTP